MNIWVSEYLLLPGFVLCKSNIDLSKALLLLDILIIRTGRVSSFQDSTETENIYLVVNVHFVKKKKTLNEVHLPKIFEKIFHHLLMAMNHNILSNNFYDVLENINYMRSVHINIFMVIYL